MLKKYKEFIIENVNSEVKIENIQDSDIPEVLDVCVEVLKDVDTPENIKEFLGEDVDFSISKKATIDGKIVGCYLFNTDSVYDFLKDCDCVKEDMSKYQNLKGIQGCALVVLPEYRNMNIGRKLREVPLKMGFDYIWGQHLKGLHNVDNWIKFGRRLVADGLIGGEDMWVTLMDLK